MLRPWVGILVLLAGCAATPHNPNSPYYQVPRGSTLTLEKPITIPGGKASVHFQGGEVTSYGSVNRYYPFCKLVMRQQANLPRTIQPDTFTVTGVSRNMYWVSRDSPLRVAANGKLAGFFSGEDSPTAYEMTTELHLHSDRQPDVYSLSCTIWQRPEFPVNYLSFDQIRETLHGLFRLELPPGSPTTSGNG